MMSIVTYQNLDAFGMIPDMLNPASDEPMWKQIDRNYAHGGGWKDYKGFTVHKDDNGKYRLSHEGDPDLHEIGRIRFGSQMIVLFDYSWVLWMSLNIDGDMVDHKIARVD
jgi:hypothetical protein